LYGRRHMARIEDITLKDSLQDASADAASLFGRFEEAFGAMSESELVAAMESLQRHMLPESDGLGELAAGDFETQPLVDLEPRLASAGGGEAAADEALLARAEDAVMPLDLDLGGDLPSARPEGNVHDLDIELIAADGLGAEIVGGEGEADLVDAGPAKRPRRRVGFQFDTLTEIPKEVYREFTRDPSSITRESPTDYTILLPHNSPFLPCITTTFTHLCPELCNFLAGARRAGDAKRRRLAKQAWEEAEKRSETLWRPPPLPDDAEVPAAGASASSSTAGALPAAVGGAVVGREASPARRLPVTELALVADAPSCMGAVVTGNMDQEDQCGMGDIRVGYSGRTEKMHRFLAKEFQEKSSEVLSYKSMCKQQSKGQRELIAGCFFELLVLKTSGVIDVRQEKAQADIHISKAQRWVQ